MDRTGVKVGNVFVVKVDLEVKALDIVTFSIDHVLLFSP